MNHQTADQRETQLSAVAAIDSRVADVMRASKKRQFAEEKTEFIKANPNAPSEDVYDYGLMFEQGKMPDTEGEGFGFLPLEGYRSKVDRYVTKPLSRYSTKTKDNQFDDWELRVMSTATRGVFESLKYSAVAIKEGVKAKNTGVVMGLDDYSKAIDEQLADSWTPFEDRITNPDLTVGAAAEELGSVIFEIGADIYLGNKALGASKAMNLAKGKGAIKRLVARLQVATSPGVVTGEILFAVNPENKGTASAMLGEYLEEEFGMSGGVIDAMKASDDSVAANIATNVIEGAIMFEALRTMALTGVRGSSAAVRSAKDFVSSRLQEADKLGRSLKDGIKE